MDVDAVAKRLIELHGGVDRMNSVVDARLAEINAIWQQNVGGIGRILRSHLFVEFFLTEFLEKRNPNIGSLDHARLSFSQKVALLATEDPVVGPLIPGMKHLNTVRNRLAHKLNSEVTKADADVFLSVEIFRALREALAQPNKPSQLPIDVLEDFGKHAGSMLSNAIVPEAKLIAQAIEDVSTGAV